MHIGKLLAILVMAILISHIVHPVTLAKAKNAKVIVVARSAKGGEGVPSRLFRRTLALPSHEIANIDKSGRKEFDEPNCSLGTMYLVVPKEWFWLPGEWRECKSESEIQFDFQRVSYASNIAPLVGTGYQSKWSRLSKAKPLEDALASAISGHQYGAVAIYSTELKSIYAAAGVDQAAKVYDIMALDAGARAVTVYEPAVNASSTANVSSPLIFDPSQSKYVISPEIKAKLMSFQEKNGVSVSGALDWGTMRMLPGGAAVSLTSPKN